VVLVPVGYGDLFGQPLPGTRRRLWFRFLFTIKLRLGSGSGLVSSALLAGKCSHLVLMILDTSFNQFGDPPRELGVALDPNIVQLSGVQISILECKRELDAHAIHYLIVSILAFVDLPDPAKTLAQKLLSFGGRLDDFLVWLRLIRGDIYQIRGNLEGRCNSRLPVEILDLDRADWIVLSADNERFRPK